MLYYTAALPSCRQASTQCAMHERGSRWELGVTHKYSRFLTGAGGAEVNRSPAG